MITVEGSCSVDIETNIYCGICGAGICSSSIVDFSNRKGLCVTATCPTCQQNIKDLEVEKEELEEKVKDIEKAYDELVVRTGGTLV